MGRREHRRSDPPAFLQLAGHPLRWRLLEELAESDRRVHELVERVGEPQNLVSYHLGKLRTGGLVSGRRSSADGRDTYYAADLVQVRSLLAEAGAALHPALALTGTPVDVRLLPAERVLYLCTGNSARSQIAEALTLLRSGGRVTARSAGSHPKPLHPLAVRVMRDEYGIDLRHARSKHVDELVEERFDRVITLCDRVREVCPELPGEPPAVHWSLPDPPSGDGDRAAFRETAAHLDRRIGLLLADLAPPAEPIPA